MVVFLDQNDKLITAVPPGEIYLKKFGTSGFHFVVSIESASLKLIHKSENSSLPPINGQGGFAGANIPISDFANAPGAQGSSSGNGITESAEETRYDFAVSSHLHLNDKSGNLLGPSYLDVLDALCVFLNSQPGGGGGGVTSIVAGTNVTISPTGGTGAVTINSSSSNSFSEDLDASKSTVSKLFSSGVTTYTVTHNLNTLDIQAEVYRINNPSDNQTVGWTILRNNVNQILCSRAGSVTDGDFRVVILK